MRPAEEVFTRAKPTLTEAEMLKADPLRNFDASSLVTTTASLPAPPSARKPPRPVKASTSNFVKPTWECPTDGPRIKGSSGKTELRRFDWDAVFRNGSEWSFEEVRAKARGLHGKEWKGDIKNWELQWHSAGCVLLPFANDSELTGSVDAQSSREEGQDAIANGQYEACRRRHYGDV